MPEKSTPALFLKPEPLTLHAQLMIEEVLGDIRCRKPGNDPELLIQLVAAIRPPAGYQPADGGGLRLAILIDLLTRQEAYARSLRGYLSNLLAARNHSFLIAEGGVLGTTGFFTELRERIGNRLLPPAINPQFLQDLIEEVFDAPDDAQWLARIPLRQWEALLGALGWGVEGETPGEAQLRKEHHEALRVLACRLAAIGVETDVVRYHPALAMYESPFLALQREIEAMLANLQTAQDPLQHAPDLAHIAVLLDQCSKAIAKIRRQARESGAAVKLGWHLTRASQIIDRLSLLLEISHPASQSLAGATSLLALLVGAVARRNSVRDLVVGVTDQLAERVTEHASQTGEHYVARDRREFYALFGAAAGAGVIVAFMALIKGFIVSFELPPLWNAMALSLNYGGGFVLVHLLGLTIATKQPAMTAATLAAALAPERTGPSPADEIADLIVQVCRSQLIAILGNMIFAVITAFAITAAWTAFSGEKLISAGHAEHLLQDLHPWRSPALAHAAIAGVCLFLAGLISGYYDNQAIYNKLRERILRLQWPGKLLGPARHARLASYMEQNSGALIGNLALGVMLGSMGTLGFLLGWPLDIRHVTFASANMAFGLSASSGGGWHFAALLTGGVLLIGLTNLAVSFALALHVALKSRRIRFAQARGVAGHLLWRLRHRPTHFLWPPRDAAPAPKADQGESCPPKARTPPL